MAKKGRQKKLSEKEQQIMRTLVLDNSSAYVTKVREHIDKEGKKTLGEHRVEKISPEKFYQDMNNPETRGQMADYVKSFNYIVSSGSHKHRKYDAEIHKFIGEQANPKAVFLGVCHGAQQYAKAQGVDYVKGDKMHRGKRKSAVKEDYHKHHALEGVPIENGQMEHHGHHKWYMPVENVGNNLEVIAEAKSDTGERFVEMYKVKGKEHYGIQAHPEKDNGQIIRNLFRHAARRAGYKTGGHQSNPQYT